MRVMRAWASAWVASVMCCWVALATSTVAGCGGGGAAVDGATADGAAGDVPAGDGPDAASADLGRADAAPDATPDLCGPASAVDAASPAGNVLAAFDTTAEGFVLSQADTPGNLAVHNGGTPPALDWSCNEGNPAPGSLRIAAPYDGYGQYVDVQKVLPAGAPLDWTGKSKLHVRFRVASGGNSDARYPGSALIYAVSAVAADGGAGTTRFKGLSNDIPVSAGASWRELMINLAAIDVNGWDLTRVITFGLQLSSGDGPPPTDGGAASDGAAPPADASGGGTPPVAPAVLFVDSFSLE